MSNFIKKPKFHNIEKIDMKNTSTGENSKIEDIKFLPNSYNIEIIKQLTQSVIMGNINNALLITLY